MVASRGEAPRPLVWVAGSRAEVKAMPRQVRRTMGIALWFAQQGEWHPDAVGMRGTLSGVTELRVATASGTYRLMYTTRLGETIYVLTAFEKKSRRGIATPAYLLSRVAHRLASARIIHQESIRREG